jgi:hypothetical protein
MPEKKVRDNPSPTKSYGNFKETPVDNGAYEDNSYGKNMGNPMQDLIGTEKVPDPLGKAK